MKSARLFLITAILLFSVYGCTQRPNNDDVLPPPSAGESPGAGARLQPTEKPDPKHSPSPAQSPNPAESPAPTQNSAAGGKSPAITDVAGTVADYYPILKNTHYFYTGEGGEYAAYNVYIDYSSDTAVQERLSNTGMTWVRVVSLAGGKAVLSFSRENSAFRENLLNMSGGSGEILLMEPVRAGTAWKQPDGAASAITSVTAKVKTPSGSYEAVCVETQGEGYKMFRYYVKGIGLVKAAVQAGEHESFSVLNEIRKDVPLAQTVRFYYPNAEDGKLYYHDSALSFNTNDATAQKLEAAYKTEFDGRPGEVLTKNTAINQLQLDQAANILHIDLSAAFITEMSGGSAYESLVLQSLANTFGGYYGVQKVIPTIDGALYESKYMEFEPGAYLTVHEGGAQLLAQQTQEPPAPTPAETENT
ncbi:MAG: GerMN domain-containing protein [Oscillospiraceae bacterium]|jgi:hypothetical protein|nr:GerMN domain-containing protein [Oscillospiraceae bacterium]